MDYIFEPIIESMEDICQLDYDRRQLSQASALIKLPRITDTKPMEE